MRRGSTPTHTLEIERDLRGATVFITYAQNKKIVLEKTGKDVIVSEDSLVTTLTQKETLLFADDAPVRVQIRYVFPDGTSDASEIARFSVGEILKDGVIAYEGED